MQRELAVNAAGQAFLFTQSIQMRCNEMMAGARADIAVKIYGDDFEVLERLATQIRDLARAIPGSGDVEFDSLGRSPLLEIRPDRPALRRYTVHAADVNRAVTGAIAGEEVGTVIDGNRRFLMVVRLDAEARREVDVMKRVPVRTDGGGMLTLGQVATFTMTDQVGAITREAGQRGSPS